MSDDLPTLTALQAAILDSLGSNEIPGHELRDRLKKHNISKSGPAFYQVMARLEEAGFVTGRYENEVIEGQVIKRRLYLVTGLGIKSLSDTVSFYSQLSFPQPAFSYA